MSRFAAAGLIAASLFVFAAATPANAQGFFSRVSAQERAVKQMPLEQRPNRFGHFYGNQIRRMNAGRIMINSNDFGSAARRYFYLP